MNTITTLTVSGMTCAHCVASVETEVGAVEGVSGVEVDLQSGMVTVTSATSIDPSVLHAAIEEAGYKVEP